MNIELLLGSIAVVAAGGTGGVLALQSSRRSVMGADLFEAKLRRAFGDAAILCGQCGRKIEAANVELLFEGNGSKRAVCNRPHCLIEHAHSGKIPLAA